MQVGLRIMDDGSDYPIMNGSNGVDTLRGVDTLKGGDTTLKAPANSTTGNNMICKGQSAIWGSGYNVGVRVQCDRVLQGFIQRGQIKRAQTQKCQWLKYHILGDRGSADSKVPVAQIPYFRGQRERRLKSTSGSNTIFWTINMSCPASSV